MNGTSGFHVCGQFINADGTLKGGAFYMVNPQISASQSSPKLAYDSIEKRFLLVWSDRSSVIKGQLIKYDAGYTYSSGLILVEPTFNVSSSNGSTKEPDVIYDEKTKNYLVTWQDNRNEATINNGYNDIYARFVSAVGVPIGEADMLVYRADNNQCNPVLAGDGSGSFIVVFESHEVPVSVVIAIAKNVDLAPV
jgi:hypothetical protein